MMTSQAKMERTRSFIGTKKGWDHFKRKARRRRMSRSFYDKRQENLLRLGYLDYQSYLSGDLWKNSIRPTQLHKHPQCFLCNADQVHHKDYSLRTLQGLSSEGLVSICGRCHYDIEFDGDYKRTLEEANLMLMAIRKARWRTLL
jgi:hypothetical protein